MGSRERSSNPQPTNGWSRRRKAAATIGAIFALLLVIGAFADDPPAKVDTKPTAAVVPTSSIDEPAAPDPRRQEAQEAEVRQDYDRAIATYVSLDEADEANRLRKVAAAVLVTRAQKAYGKREYRAAQRTAQTAIRRYGRHAAGATRVRNQSSTQIRRAAERRRQRDAARRAAAAERQEQARVRRAQERQQREQAKLQRAQAREAQRAEAAAPPATSGAYSGNRYPGQTCPEIGHSWQVVPGTDMQHDRDGNGVACQAFPSE